MKKVLVTGACGMLGTDVCRAIRTAGFREIATARRSANGLVTAFDVADPIAANQILNEHAPDAVIHCAAYTQVDRAETEKGMAFRDNMEASHVLATACEGLNIPLCHISTDFVFDGEKGEPYVETDLPNPISVYGASKLAAEEAVRAAQPSHWIVRTSWLFGLHGKCFPDTILRAAETHPELKVVSDQRGTPTFTEDLASVLVRLIQYPHFGTFHLTNTAEEGFTTWHEIAGAALKFAGLPTVVRAIATNEWPTPARRPACSALRSSSLDRFGLPPLRPWQEALEDYVERRRAAFSATPVRSV